MRRYVIILLAVLPLAFFAYKNKGSKPVVDLVFCMDLSNSTNGITDIFRDQIWSTINNFQNFNPQPRVRIAIVGYGRPDFGGESNYTKILSPFTEDIDQALSEIYFIDKSTNSSKSVTDVGFQTCLKELDWTTNKNSLRQIFVIGNGPLGSSAEALVKMVPKAVKKDINVQLVFLQRDKKMIGYKSWVALADIAGDSLEVINVNNAMTYSPDGGSEEMLTDAGSLLNETYIYYGFSGEMKKSLMEKIDLKSRETGSRGEKDRILFKTSAMFQGQNHSWDLVDLSKQPYFAVGEIDKRLLPKEY